MQGEPKLVKVRLTNRGEDSETPWAEDLGPADGALGSRTVRLVNVPYLHAKPTWGDVIVVSPDPDDLLTWDRDGVPFHDLATRLAIDGGRHAMIVDYTPRARQDSDAAFEALHRACEAHDVVCEGGWAPLDGAPGRVYLAAPASLAPRAVMKALAAANPCALTCVHPAAPPKAKPRPKPRAKPTARKPPRRKPATRPPARRAG